MIDTALKILAIVASLVVLSAAMLVFLVVVAQFLGLASAVVGWLV